MTHRAAVLLKARLLGGRAEELPVAPLLIHGLVASALGWIAREKLGLFPYGVYMLTAAGALVALPLLGEFGYLLRADPAEEWVSALPATRRELRAARALHALAVLGWLALGSLLPAAVFAPEGATLAARALLFAGGLGLVAFLAAALLAAQALLGERAEPLLVLLQTALFAGAIAGFVLGPTLFPMLRPLAGLGDAPWTWLWPPAWFAAPLGGLARASAAAPLLALAAAAAVFLGMSPPPARRAARRTPLLARALKPLRALATRFWVRRDERAVFDLVYDALPLEREVVLRTYPLVGVPLAFLVAGAAGATQGTASDLLAMLLFTACIYMPVLLMHVPASESHAARWLLETHAVPEGALAAGVIKAVALRFLVPLYVLLAALAWVQVGPLFVVRLAVPGCLLSLLVLRALYSTTVRGLPLSVPPDRIESKFDWGGSLAGYGVVLAGAGVLVNRMMPTLAHGLLLIALLLALEVLSERRLRARLG
jgi:hypothetical protein